MTAVIVRRQEGKRLSCTAGAHEVATDRKPADGGNDSGCTSGELLLMAIGSCATGSVRTYLDQQNVPCPGLSTQVSFEPSRTGGERDAIAIDICVPESVARSHGAAIEKVPLEGGVVGRLLLGSELVIRCLPASGEALARPQ